MSSQQQHQRLTFRQWMEAYYIASIPTILTMENFRITTAVASMLKTLARNKRPSVKPEIMLEELIEDAYRKKFRR
tara:strand:- start:686 stop:910 length:225 start_codon:yes stop_codon:yes gene_type:complete